MSGTVRLALVGCGRHMFNQIYDHMKNLPIELVAICDTNQEMLDRFSNKYHVARTYSDYREMLQKEQLDAVVCVVNPQVHYEVARDCMLAGVAVFVEKTPCQNLAQAQELLDVQKKTGRYVMVGFNRRFATAYLIAREIIGRSEFGRTAMYLAKYNSSEYKSDEYFVLNHLIHHLDIARYFIGEIKELNVARIKLSDRQVGYHLLFTAESGAIGMIQSGSLQHEPYPMERIEITGDGRNVIIDNVKRVEYNRPGGNKEAMSGVMLADGRDALVWNLNLGHSSGYSHIGYERELAYFIDCVQNQQIPEPNFEDTIHTMEFFDRIKKAGFGKDS